MQYEGHRCCSKVLEIQRKVGATARVDSGVTRLSWRFFEGLPNDELIASVVLSSDAEDIIA